MVLGRVRVAGHSMEPALQHGDEILYARLPPRVGSVVVARDPRDEMAPRLIVKRVAAIDGEDVILSSDHAGHESVLVRRRDLVGRAILRYRPSVRWISAPSSHHRSPAPIP